MPSLFLFSAPGGVEIIIILVIILLLFGGKKIPELFKGVGKGMKEFEDARNDKGQDKEQNKKD